MLRATILIDLLNAAAGSGPVVVDAAVLRWLFRGFCAVSAALAGLTALVVRLAASSRRRSAAEGRRAGGEGRVEPGERVGIQGESLRQLESMIRKTNDRNNFINSVFASIEDGLLLVDPSGGVSLYNPKARDLLGLGPELFFRRGEASSGAEPAVPRAPEEPAIALILSACRRVGAAAPTTQETLLLETRDGRSISVRVCPITDKYRSGREFGTLAVIGDVTELRRLENLKKDFVANVSHEFRTPLTLISGFIEMFMMGGAVPEPDRLRAFEIMDLETERLKRLVSELLTLSEMESELPFREENSIDVATVLGRLTRSMESLATQKGLSLRVDLAQDIPLLRGNENWFYLAVRNLIENAIKYTLGGSGGGEIRLAASYTDGEIMIEVADTGIGIAEADLERIFERFYRVEKARGSGRGGSGLGLSLVKDVAAIFGGRVSVASRLGAGSVFTLTLPTRELYEDNANGGAYGV